MERRPANAIDVQVVGKQWMWKLQHAEGQTRDQRAACAGRSHGRTDYDVAGRDPQFFRPRLSGETGCRAGQVHQRVVQGQHARVSIICFVQSIAGRSIRGMIGRVVVMEPPAHRVAKAGEQTESIVACRRAAFSRSRLQRLSLGTNSKFHAPLLEGLYGKPVPLADGKMVTADDQYLRDSILLPAKQITAGYDNIMPSFTGHLSEEEIMQLIAYLKAIGQQAAAESRRTDPIAPMTRTAISSRDEQHRHATPRQDRDGAGTRLSQ